MSTIFSDPGWRRGSTLLNGEVIELDSDNQPVAGREIVGQVKVFQDVNPYTGARFSNRLVYCIAARYVPVDGVTKINVNNADAGRAYVLSRRNGLATFSDQAAAGDRTDRCVGVLDEYLTEEVRPNDIVWLVVKGPVACLKGNTVVIPGGLPVEVTASGLTIARTATVANMTGTSIDSAFPLSANTTNTSVNVTMNTATIVAEMPVTGAGIPSGAYVASVPNSTTATLSSAATATATGVTLFFGGPLRTATTARVNLISDHI